jgi:hypothetical protein
LGKILNSVLTHCEAVVKKIIKKPEKIAAFPEYGKQAKGRGARKSSAKMNAYKNAQHSYKKSAVLSHSAAFIYF